MGKIFRVFIIVAGAILLPGGLASAAGPGFCYKYAPALVHEAEQTKVRGGCGQNMSDSFWSRLKQIQMQWCLANSEDTVKTRVREMQLVNQKCDYCQGYADTLASAADYNIKNRCGFTYDGDERWKPDRQFHFIGCMKFESNAKYENTWHGNRTHSGELFFVKDDLDSIVGDVSVKIKQCQAERGAGTSSSALSVPKAIPPLQDKIDRPKRASTPAKKCKSPTATKGCSAGSHATVKPAPKGSVTSGNDLAKPSGGSNAGAMDRLSGDSQLPTANNPGSRTGEGSRRVPASGGASAVAKPVSNTPAVLPKADPTVDFGKCASCGKLTPAPTR